MVDYGKREVVLLGAPFLGEERGEVVVSSGGGQSAVHGEGEGMELHLHDGELRLELMVD